MSLSRCPSVGSRIRKTPVGIVGLGLLALIVLLAVFAPILWGDKASAVDTENILAGPSAQHWFGTDNLGRDLFFRVLVATRLSLTLTLAATALGTVIGLVLGTAPQLLGGRLGRLVTAFVNVFVAFPGLLLVLVFAVIFGVGARGAVLAIGLAVAPAFARLCQTLVAGVAGLEYVAAARIAGVNRFRIMARHVLPNVGRAAHRQRDHHRRRHPARASPGCRSSGSASRRRSTTGAG